MNPDSSLRMKERPILFSGQMVRAILEGRKTQTRRIVKPQPDGIEETFSSAYPYRISTDGNATNNPILCPYGQPGGRLWVKETWATAPNFDHMKPTDLPEGISILKRANQGATGGKWRPSIFMRRWMSRITLEIESVRVERLQDISEEDAIAEGIEEVTGESGMIRFRSYRSDFPSRPLTAYESYRSLWVAINGPGSWDLNPWVWVVTFKRIKP